MQGFLDTSPEQLQQVVETNLLGTLLCSRRALKLMAAQPEGGHIFNLDGAGADGLSTPCYAAYGATKAGLVPSLTVILGTFANIYMCMRLGLEGDLECLGDRIFALQKPWRCAAAYMATKAGLNSALGCRWGVCESVCVGLEGQQGSLNEGC